MLECFLLLVLCICLHISLQSFSRLLHRAIIKKRRSWRRYVSRMSASNLAAFKAQSRPASSLSRKHRSKLELRVLLTYSSQNFWRFRSKRIVSRNGVFSLPMTNSSLTVTDLINRPNTFDSFSLQYLTLPLLKLICHFDKMFMLPYRLLCIYHQMMLYRLF